MGLKGILKETKCNAEKKSCKTSYFFLIKSLNNKSQNWADKDNVSLINTLKCFAIELPNVAMYVLKCWNACIQMLQCIINVAIYAYMCLCQNILKSF